MSPIRRFSDSRVSAWILVSSILIITCIPRFILSANVTLESMEIFKTNDVVAKPTVYFKCKGENKIVLPDVTHKLVTYTFKGEESWQPLVDLLAKKCKRCGFYEEDTIDSDDVFDEWEFCPSEFTDGKYFHSKNGEFNATFSCPQCVYGTEASTNQASGSQNGLKGGHILIMILISVLASVIVVLGMIASYKYWLKKKRAKDQARFLKLFEEGDDIEDELGLAEIIAVASYLKYYLLYLVVPFSCFGALTAFVETSKANDQKYLRKGQSHQE